MLSRNLLQVINNDFIKYILTLSKGNNMKPLKSSELHLFLGRKVRVTYIEEDTSNASLIFIDQMITPEGVLKDFHIDDKTVVIQTSDSKQRKIKFYEIFCVD